MSNMTKRVKEQRQKEVSKSVVNFMGGKSYELNPLDMLKMVSASSVFGEPQYYRRGEFAQKGVSDGVYRMNGLVKSSILDETFSGKKTSDIMEELIDHSLSYDFENTLRWAVELRNNYYMRLNPQIVMVRAAKHPERKNFTEENPGLFKEINNQVMRRADEPSLQFTYWLYNNGSKKSLPNLLKRSWKERIESMNRYHLAKYKNAGVGMIDTVRVTHAKGDLVDELMKTGTVKMEDDNTTWNRLRQQGKSWLEIVQTINLPHMALLRNLRGIFEEVEDREWCSYLMNELKRGVTHGKQFPFRYFSAMKVIQRSDVHHKPLILDALEECMDIARENFPRLEGKTMCLSDNSGSAYGGLTSEYGTVNVAEIDNLSSVLTAQNSDEGYVGVFGDRLTRIPISKRNGALNQTTTVSKKGQEVGMGTENGIWIFFKEAIENKEHWDNIFIYSDQQAGHGGLFGIEPSEYQEFIVGNRFGRHIDVLKLVRKYRQEVNPKVNVYTVQTAGYNNALVPEMEYRTNVLYGWTGKEALFAERMNSFWDEIDARKENANRLDNSND